MKPARLPARSLALGIAAAAFAVVLSGCTDVKEALNQGGDTPCSEYVQQSPDDKRMTITKFVKEHNNTDNEPTGTAVDASMIGVDAMCAVQRNADTPIKNANIEGIFFNR